MRDMPQRDLVYLAWGNWGPYHYARLDAFAELAATRGFRVVGLELYRGSGLYNWQYQQPKAPMVRLNFPPPEDRVRPFRMIFNAAPLIFRSRPAVIFATSYRPSSLMLNVFGRLCGARIVMMNDTHQHTTRDGAVRGLFKRLIVRRFHAALVGGSKHKQFAVSLGLSPDRVFLGYDAVDNSFYSEESDLARERGDSTRAEHILPPRYVLSLGRLLAKKNVETLVAAFAVARKSPSCADLSLVIVGDGPEREHLIQVSQSHGLTVTQSPGQTGPEAEADVHLLPSVGPRAVAAILGLAEVFVLASTTEEWGLVVNEAAACGLPLLVSSAAGCADELCKDGVNGYQFDPTDIAVLAARIVELASLPHIRERYGIASRQIVSEWGLERFASGALAATMKSIAPRSAPL